MDNHQTPLGAWSEVINPEPPSSISVAVLAVALLVLPFALLLIPPIS